jgi:hypothetical protein
LTPPRAEIGPSADGAAGCREADVLGEADGLVAEACGCVVAPDTSPDGVTTTGKAALLTYVWVRWCGWCVVLQSQAFSYGFAYGLVAS